MSSEGSIRVMMSSEGSIRVLVSSEGSDVVGQVVLTSTSLSATFTGLPTSFGNWLPTTCKPRPESLAGVTRGLAGRTADQENKHTNSSTTKARQRYMLHVLLHNVL